MTKRKLSPEDSARTPIRGEAKSVLNCFRSLVRELRIADRSALAESGLGSAQVFVLHQLEAESPLSMTDLAERTATDQSTVSVVVAKLVGKRLVKKTPSRTDARRVELELTPKGRELARRLPAAFQQTLVDAVMQLPERRIKELAKTLDELVHILGASERPPMLLVEDAPARRKKR